MAPRTWRAAITLRTKLAVTIAAVFSLLSVAIAALQADLVDRLVIGQATERVARNIETAWAILHNRQQRAETVAGLLALTDAVREAEQASPERLQRFLDETRERWGLDLVGARAHSGEVIAFSYSGQERTAASAVTAVLPSPRRAAAGAAVLPPEGRSDKNLWLLAQSPVLETGGAVFAGVLLDRAEAIVDEIEQTLYPSSAPGVPAQGTATIFLGDKRIATTVRHPEGLRAVGTRATPEVAAEVLDRGLPWTGRASVLGVGYLARYEPLRDLTGKVVGMLYVGEPERYYLDRKREALLESIAVVLAVALFGFIVSQVVGGRMVGQIRALERTTERIAAGELSARVPVTSHDELGRLATTFNRMAGDLEKDRAHILEQKRTIEGANQSYMEMLSFVTHELRNTLGTATFNVELLKEGSYGPLQGDQPQGLDLVSGSLGYLSELLENYLQLSRIEKGELLLKNASVALLRDVIRPAAALHDSVRTSRGMRLEVQVPNDLDVLGDVSLLRAVYDNLVGNAVKYGREGAGIVLSAQPEQQGWVRLTIWNEGQGIRADRVPTLFRKFQRYDVDEVTGKRGTGLGLFIVRQIVEQHGGRVWAESEEGKWAAFHFTVQLAPAVDPTQRVVG